MRPLSSLTEFGHTERHLTCVYTDKRPREDTGRKRREASEEATLPTPCYWISCLQKQEKINLLFKSVVFCYGSSSKLILSKRPLYPSLLIASLLIVTYKITLPDTEWPQPYRVKINRRLPLGLVPKPSSLSFLSAGLPAAP